MRPPNCDLCHDDCNAHEGLLYFAEDERSKEWHARSAAEPGFVGHPPDAGWFCDTHLAAARELTHLPRSEAIARLREDAG